MSNIMSRRKALLRIGGIAAAAYAIPTITTISSAHAKDGPTWGPTTSGATRGTTTSGSPTHGTTSSGSRGGRGRGGNRGGGGKGGKGGKNK